MKNINLTIGHVTKETLINLLINQLINGLVFKNGANLLEIIKEAQIIGLNLYSVEVTQLLRLNYQQTDTQGIKRQFKTPERAVTVVSEILKDQVSFPKGFYLRKIDGELWLRAYICDYEHIFESHEYFIFERQVINEVR